MTNHWTDIANADVILIIGSNAAENHPISFKWVTKAKEKGAKLIVVDPRFTRSAALADIYAPIRPGTNIAFFGGLFNYILRNKLYHEEYVVNYTNASFLIKPEYSFKDGMFSGYDKEKRKYDPATWGYQMSPPGPDGKTVPLRDKTLQDPNCVFQLLKKHYARYTPEMVEKICGTPKDAFLEVAKTYCATGKPGKAGTILYAMGQTQFTVGTQNIRAMAMLQLLLGNIGIAGGGVNALRGHSNVQGHCDMGILAHVLTGYNPIPLKEKHPTLKDYIEKETPKASYWVNRPKFLISVLKAFYGENATKENDFLYDYLPKVTTSGTLYSTIPIFEAIAAGKIKGLLCWGMNPLVVAANAGRKAEAMHNLDWLVAADIFETETATFWKRPGVSPANIKTEIFLLPTAARMEREGCFTNSGRLIQWGWKGANPPGEAKWDLSILNELYLTIKDLYKKDPKAVSPDPIVKLNWDYGRGETLDVEKVTKEISGYTVADGKPVLNFTKLADDGSTACGSWIYSGIYPEDGKNLTKRRIAEKEGIGLNSEWGYAWPLNRRIVYNRCSADPTGKPYNKDKWLVRWNEAEKKWETRDVPDFGWKDAKTGEMIPPEKSAAAPFIMVATETVGRLFGTVADGPLPEHYEPFESPVKNPLSPVQSNPAAKIWPAEVDKLAPVGSPEYPFICSTYRISEQWHSGTITRNLPWLCELMPNLFAEISPELAQAKGIRNGDKVTIATPRGKIEAIACVSERIKALQVDGKKVEIVGLPWHWGWTGIAKGDVTNWLTPQVADPSVFMPETKVFLCNIEKAVA